MNKLKKLLIILTSISIINNIGVISANAQTYDSKDITYINVLELKKAILGVSPITDDILNMTDINNDEKLNILDLVEMKNILLNNTIQVPINSDGKFYQEYTFDKKDTYVFGTKGQDDILYSVQSNIDDDFYDRVSTYYSSNNDVEDSKNILNYAYLSEQTENGTINSNDTTIFEMVQNPNDTTCLCDATTEFGNISSEYTDGTLNVNLEDLNVNINLSNDLKYQENTLGNVNVYDGYNDTISCGATLEFDTNKEVKSLTGAFDNKIFSVDDNNTFKYHDNQFKVIYNPDTEEYQICIDGTNLETIHKGDYKNYDYGNYEYAITSGTFSTDIVVFLENKSNKDKLQICLDKNNITEIKAIDTISQGYINMIDYKDNQIVSKLLSVDNVSNDSKQLIFNSNMDIVDYNITYYKATPTSENVNYYDDGTVLMLSKEKSEDSISLGVQLGSYNKSSVVGVTILYGFSIEDTSTYTSQSIKITDTNLNNTITASFDGLSYKFNRDYQYKSTDILGTLSSTNVSYTHKNKNDFKNIIIK